MADLIALKLLLKQNIVKQITAQREMDDSQLVELINQEILQCTAEEFISIQDKVKLRKELFNSLRKLDVLQELIEDKSIT